MFSVQSPRPLRGGQVADSGRELRRENKVSARAKAMQRETVSARKKREEQERLDAAEDAQYRRVWELGNELFYKGKYQEAAAHYSEAMKKNPNEPAVFRNRAQCHIFLGALPEGLEDAEKCIELDPTYLMGYVCKAKVQALMQNYESSMETYIEGLKCDPNNHVIIERCMACIQRSKGGDVGCEDLNDILRDWHSDIALCIELKKNMEEVAVLKKEAADERLRRIESERMDKISEANQMQQQKEAAEYLSKIQQELQQVKAQHDEVTDKLQKANKHNENVQRQLLETEKRHIEEMLEAIEHGEKILKAIEHSNNVQQQFLEYKERHIKVSSSPSSSSFVQDESSEPSHFICPISLEIMKEPHITADGYTYEGDYIRQWLKGNNKSPMTLLPLRNRELIPNLVLRSAIQEWLQQHN